MPQLVPGWFGKLPWQGDFLRAAPTGAPLDLIDAWLAPAPVGPPSAASPAFDAAGPSFAMVHARGQWWGIALFPSRDAVGRRFPFCVLAGVPEAEFAGEPALVPAVFAPFFLRCFQRAAAGWPGDVQALREAVAACGGNVDLAAEERRLVELLGDQSVGSLFQGMLGRADDPRRAGVWADITAAPRSPDRFTGLHLRPMANQLHLAFWLMLLRLSGDDASQPVMISMRPGSPALAPGVTVLWGRPSAAECLAALWPGLPGAVSERLHDPVARPGTVGDPDVSPEALDEPETSLRDVLHDVGSVTSRHTRGAPVRHTSRFIRKE